MAETPDDGRNSREDFDFNTTAAERGRERGSHVTRLCLAHEQWDHRSGCVHKQKNVRSQTDVVLVVRQGCFVRRAGLRSLCIFFLVTITVQNRGHNHFHLHLIPLSPQHFHLIILPSYHFIVIVFIFIVTIAVVIFIDIIVIVSIISIGITIISYRTNI